MHHLSSGVSPTHSPVIIDKTVLLLQKQSDLGLLCLSRPKLFLSEAKIVSILMYQYDATLSKCKAASML